MSDPVNKPAHYNAGEVETIDGIRAALGEGFADYCRGNVLKYVWRCGKKGDAVEDLRKAATYLQWAIEAMEGNCPVIPDSSSRKPLAIPAGWRELEPDEVPVSTDLHEWAGGWYYRNTESTHEYKWHGSRHIRKIETANSSEIPNSSTPDPGEGYRLLSKDPPEDLQPGDDFHNRGKWLRSTRADDGITKQRDKCYYRRKMEAKPTEWMPKVGDKVRLLKGFSENIGKTGVVQKVDERIKDVFLIDFSGFVEGWYSTHDAQLIEAAS